MATKPKAPAPLAESLRLLARHMDLVSRKMRYYGGFDREAVQHAAELAGAAGIVRTWARGARRPKTKTPHA